MNLPLPAERNRLAACEILALAAPDTFAGFSADLLIIELNSETEVHDGKEPFYTAMKAGKPYNGFYAKPWREACELFQAPGTGQTP